MSIKKCLRCGEEKNVSFFHQDKRRPDGYVTICRKCVSAKRKLAYGSHSVKKEDVTENIPCEGCRWTEKCRSQHMSCKGYREWVLDGKENDYVKYPDSYEF